jgi:hypothetical protein
MAQLNVFLYLFLFTLAMSAATLVKVLALRKDNRLLAEQLTETSVTLEQTRAKLASVLEKQEKAETFENRLGTAELTTKLQQPRLGSAYTSERQRHSPEKYGFIHSLAQRGMSAEEIAAILTISAYEARQLVTLAKIGTGNCMDQVIPAQG